jgi:hypothetical protein
MPASAPPFNLAGIAWLARMKVLTGFPAVQLPDTVLDGLLGVLVHRRRGPSPSPFELPGTCMFNLHWPINGS